MTVTVDEEQPRRAVISAVWEGGEFRTHVDLPDDPGDAAEQVAERVAERQAMGVDLADSNVKLGGPDVAAHVDAIRKRLWRHPTKDM